MTTITTPARRRPLRTQLPTSERSIAPVPFAVVTTWKTPFGWVAIEWGETEATGAQGLVRQLVFAHADRAAALAALRDAIASRNLIDSATPPQLQLVPFDRLPTSCCDTVARIDDYTVGRPVSFSQVPIDTTWQTAFQREVILACREVAWGETITYGDLAKRVGHPGAARAVGTVMSHNRCPLIVPCHRVVPAGGKLGGFSAPGGVHTKERLLRHESAIFMDKTHG